MARLPDCMLPDGAEPCMGYQELAERIERLAVMQECVPDFAEIARKCLRPLRGCATDDQWREATGAVENALLDAYLGPVPPPTDKLIQDIDF